MYNTNFSLIFWIFLGNVVKFYHFRPLTFIHIKQFRGFKEKSLFSLCSWSYLTCEEGHVQTRAWQDVSALLIYQHRTYDSCNLISHCLTLVRVTVCVCRDVWLSLLTRQSPRCFIHSKRERERERPQEPLYSLTCATSLSPRFLWAPAFAETCAEPALLHLQPQPMHCAHAAQQEAFVNAHTQTNTHKHHCCILCESYGMATYRGMLVSSPHPSPYREKLHRTGRSDSALSHRAQTSVCAHWCGLFETWYLYFLFVLPSCQSFYLTYLTPAEISYSFCSRVGNWEQTELMCEGKIRFNKLGLTFIFQNIYQNNNGLLCCLCLVISHWMSPPVVEILHCI